MSSHYLLDHLRISDKFMVRPKCLTPGPEVIKHMIFHVQLSCQSIKGYTYTTIVGILTLISRINFSLRRAEHEKRFITSRPE